MRKCVVLSLLLFLSHYSLILKVCFYVENWPCFCSILYFGAAQFIQPSTRCVALILFYFPSAKRTICVHQPSRTGVTLIDGIEAGNFKNVGEAESIVECLNLACNRQTGNIAFLWGKTCYMVTCKQKNRCGLLSDASMKTKGALYMILCKLESNVNIVSNDCTLPLI